VLGYRAGIRNETDSFSGMAAIVSHYLQSTPAARSLALAAYGSGGSVEFLDEPDRTALRIRVPSWAAPMVVNAAAAFFAATPDKDRNVVDRARASVLANASEQATEFRAKVEAEIRIDLLGSHPYTHPPTGWKSDVEQVSTDDVIRFFTENYGTDRAFVVVSSSLPDDLRAALSSVKGRKSRPLPEFTRRLLNAERTIHFEPEGTTGAAIFAAPIPGVYYREWYATLLLDRIVRRTFREKPMTALTLTVDPYYWRVEIPVTLGQQADSVEETLLQNINRLQFSRVKPEDLEAARQDAAAFLNSSYVREWFASEGLNERLAEGLQWIQSLTADDIRAAVRDLIAANRLVASWAPKPKQNTVPVESLSSTPAVTNVPSANITPLPPVAVAPFPPHPPAAKQNSTPERLPSGVWLATSTIYAVFLSGAEASGLPDNALRLGPNGALWQFPANPDDATIRKFQKYKADRILVLTPPDAADQARKLWSSFKSNEGDATVVTPLGNVANIDMPALVIIKSILDRMLIESGWWHDAAVHIDATVGATLTFDASAQIRTQIMTWLKTIATSPLTTPDFVWARAAAANHLRDVLPDVQILLWQRVHDYILPDLETISPTQVQDAAKLYF
jgi:predicted Zn-dependent peptidase